MQNLRRKRPLRFDRAWMQIRYGLKEFVMPNDLKLTTRTGRKVNVRPDTLDFRDRMFEPTLVKVFAV